MATYVLVHGAWSGAHGFRRVRTALQDTGHQVFTPSLTGVGERADLTSPGVGLARDFDDPAEAVFMNARRMPHPLGCFTEAIRLTDALEDHAFTRTYIRATADRADALGASAFDAAAKRAQESRTGATTGSRRTT